jgi:Phage-related minor tail protein
MSEIKFNEVFDDQGEIGKLIAKIKELNAEYKKMTADIQQQASKAEEGLKGMNVSTASGREEVKKAAVGADQLLRAYKGLTLAMSDNNKTIKEIKENTRTVNRIRTLEAKININAKGSYNALSAEMGALKVRYKQLTQEEIRNTEQGRKLVNRINEINGTLKKLDSNVGVNTRNVGNYKSALSGLGATVKRIAGTFLGLAAAQRVIRNFFSTITGFGKKMSAVRAISGATDEEFKALERDAKRLGKTTSKTAKEVAGLQKEFALLGFSTKEILAATEATVLLSQATDEDLAKSAAAAGTTIRAFGLDASNTKRIVDIMAKSFTSSALNLERYTESMKFVAPVAKSAGISVEKTTALLSALADAGIHGSMAGTALRKIMLEFAKDGKSIGEAITDLAKRGLSLADANDEVGQRAQTALLVLTENVSKVDDLADAYQNAAGSAKEMANIQLDNLSGSVTLLSSAWDGLMLAFEKSSGIFRGVIDSIRDLVVDITDLVNPQDALLNSYNEQVDAIERASKRIPVLLSQYGELNAKTKLTTGEHEKMRAVIGEIVDIFPQAATAYDDLGRATALNTDKVIELADKQEQLVKGTKAALITSIREEIASLNERIAANDEMVAKSEKWGLSQKRINETIIVTNNLRVELSGNLREQKKLLAELTGATIALTAAEREAQDIGELEKAKIKAANDNLEREKQSLLQLRINFEFRKEILNNTIESEQAFAADELKTFADRANALDRALDANKELATGREGIARKELQITRLESKIAGETAESRLKVEEKRAALLRVQTQAAKRSQKIIKHGSMNRMKAMKEENAAIINALKTKKDTELSKFKALRDFGNRSIAYQEWFNVRYFTLNQKLSLEILEQQKKLGLITEAEFAAQIIKMQAALNEFGGKFSVGAADAAEKRVQEIAAMMLKKSLNTYKEMKEELETVGKEFNFWESVFGIDDKQAQQNLDNALSKAKQQMTDFFNTYTQLATQRVSDSDRIVAAAENELNRQTELQAAGLANTAAASKKELQIAKARQKQALEDQRKAQRAQIAVDAALQASNLAVGIAKLWKNPGWPLALPLTAVLLGSFTAAKFKAFQLAKKREFKKGGLEFLDYGGSHASGNDIPLGTGGDGKTPMAAERGEALAVINRRNTIKYRPLLPVIIDSLNKGVFEQKFMNLAAAGKDLPLVPPQIIINNSTMEKHLAKLVEQGEERGIVDGDGNLVRKINNRTITEVR